MAEPQLRDRRDSSGGKSSAIKPTKRQEPPARPSGCAADNQPSSGEMLKITCSKIRRASLDNFYT